MPMRQKELARRLDVDEPDYEALAHFGPNIVPHLRTLVRADSIALAAKATALAGFIGSSEGLAVIEEAAAHVDPRVRVAAAGALGHLKRPSSPLVAKLLRDVHPSVRVRTLKSLKTRVPKGIRVTLQELIATDPDDSVRSVARALWRRARR
jgi:HEAT repeat protein